MDDSFVQHTNTTEYYKGRKDSYHSLVLLTHSASLIVTHSNEKRSIHTTTRNRSNVEAQYYYYDYYYYYYYDYDLPGKDKCKATNCLVATKGNQAPQQEAQDS